MQESLFIGKNVIQLDTTPSTNDYLKQLCDKQAVLDGTVVYTSNQTAGRGQQGNTWEMQKGAGLALSFFLKPNFLPIEKQFYLNMAVSLAVREFCEYFTDQEVAVKWPNDILINQKKVAGILIENTIQGSKIAQTVVGIGVNVTQKKFSSDLVHATSLSIQCENGDIDFNIKSMLSVMSAYLEKYYLQLRQENYPVSN
jgi:BirA family biotin operon repressor/biotin-[acetyl-CoA-carboxylase] ligase